MKKNNHTKRKNKFFFFINLGNGIIPYIMDFAIKSNIPPLVAFGIIGLFGSLSFIFLKETINEPLEDEIRELSRSESDFSLIK